MKQKINKRAFTLIELSIVLIIIGLITAGVLAGKSLVDISRISKAKSLSDSSPILSIEKLALWLEATSNKNVSVDANNLVDIWYDKNPQSLPAINSTASGTAKPLYNKSGINGLPALEFDGIDDYIDTHYLFSKKTTDGWTMFLVFENTGITTLKAIFGKDFFYLRTDSVLRNFIGNSGGTFLCCSTTFNIGNSYIVTITNNGSTGQISFYSQGLFNANQAVGDYSINNNSFYIGAINNNNAPDGLGGYGNITVGEFIIYDKYLFDSERDEVHKYLSKKWGIKLL